MKFQLRPLLMLLCMLFSPFGAKGDSSGAKAIESAPGMLMGTLEVGVKVEGKGTEQAQPGAGWKYINWSVLHEASFKVPLVSQARAADGSPVELPDAPEPSAEEEARQEALWDKKTEACKGDPACEMQVAIDRMNNPQNNQQMQLQALSVAVMPFGPGLGSQPWATHAAARAGTVRITQHEDTFGVIASEGGTVDNHCIRSGEETLQVKPDGMPGDTYAPLIINIANGSYELQLPADYSLVLNNRCDNGSQTYEQTGSLTMQLLGNKPVGVPNWPSALTVRGKITGSINQPVFEGSKVVQADLLDVGPGAGRPIKVTLSWKFKPGQ